MRVEKDAKFIVGAPVPGVDKKYRRKIGEFVGGFSHLVLDQFGYTHVYWNGWVKEADGFKKVLIHHGGPKGFEDIQKSLDQHLWVISRNIGVETELPPSSARSQLLRPPFTLRTYAQALRISEDRIAIPGEQHWINDCFFHVQGIIRGAAVRMPASELNTRLYSLEKLQQKFQQARSPKLQVISLHLAEAIRAGQEGERDKAMAALLASGRDINERAQEISDILATTIKRYSALERLRNSMEDIVKDLKNKVVEDKDKWDHTEDPDERRRIILHLSGPSVAGRLSELKVQPFRKKASRSSIAKIRKLSEFEDWEKIGEALTEASLDLGHWHQQIEKRVKGEYNERYPAKA